MASKLNPFYGIAAIGTLGLMLGCQKEAATSSAKPNILIILADDMGFSDAGCYGGEIATPNLDNLALGGLRFTQVYNTGRCWPTRACILTGYYAQQVRRAMPDIPSGGGGVRPTWARLLPEMLKPLGYRSYHSGKWHMDGKPIAAGFDHSYYIEDCERHFSPRVHFEDDQKLPAVQPGSGYYSTTVITDYAIQQLKDHAKRYAGQPFFQYLAYTAPHFPLQAWPEDIAKYRDQYLIGWDKTREIRWRRMKEMGIVNCDLSAMERDVGPPYDFPDAFKLLGPGESKLPLPWLDLTEQQRAFQSVKMSIHAAMIDRMDREIGRVLDQLRTMNAIDNTVIFFLSDNGASAEIMVRGDGHDPAAPPGSAASHLCLGPGFSSHANTPFRRHKTWVHEGGIATPFIVHWPKGILAHGELRHTPGHVIDFVPTILELAGAAPTVPAGTPPLPGKSLVPALLKDVDITRDYLFFQHENNRAIRVGDWKLVAAGASAPWELYDFRTDRCESRNLATTLPEKARELEKLWIKHFEEFRATAAKDIPPGSGVNKVHSSTPELWWADTATPEPLADAD